MAKVIANFRLRRNTLPQSIKMPRRARITGMKIIGTGTEILDLYAEVEVDADTRAFDTGQHERTFAIRTRGEIVPDGGGLVAFDQGIHVYEVQP